MHPQRTDLTAASGEAGDCRTRRACLLAGTASAVLFTALLGLVVGGWGPLLSLDARIAEGLHDVAVAHPDWTRANRILTDWVWDPWTMRALLAASAIWLLRRGASRQALFLAVCAVAGAALQQGVKAAVGRERPRWPDAVDSAHFAAFPSGHAMSATIVCGALLWLFLRSPPARSDGVWRTTAWAVTAVTVLGAGLTRVCLGVHWPTDVVAGWLLGSAVVVWAAAVSPPWPGSPGTGDGARQRIDADPSPRVRLLRDPGPGILPRAGPGRAGCRTGRDDTVVGRSPVSPNHGARSRRQLPEDGAAGG